jgi:hypothetical protein
MTIGTDGRAGRRRAHRVAPALDVCDGKLARVLPPGIRPPTRPLEARAPIKAAASVTTFRRSRSTSFGIRSGRGWQGPGCRRADKITELNALVKAIADRLDVAVLPFYAALEDPERGRIREDCTSDGNHRSVAGYRLLGERALPIPGPDFTPAQWTPGRSETASCRGYGWITTSAEALPGARGRASVSYARAERARKDSGSTSPRSRPAPRVPPPVRR